MKILIVVVVNVSEPNKKPLMMSSAEREPQWEVVGAKTYCIMDGEYDNASQLRDMHGNVVHIYSIE